MGIFSSFPGIRKSATAPIGNKENVSQTVINSSATVALVETPAVPATPPLTPAAPAENLEHQRLLALAEAQAREEQRQRTHEIVRIKRALDAVTSNVMMADAENRIVYMNVAVQNMLQVAEADLRKDLPHFSASRVLGNSVDIFHKNPQHQRMMLERLKAPHRAQISVGGRAFSLIATPVFDDTGVRLGTVVEWQDNTEELRKFEQMVNSAIDSAANGQLSNRINTQGLVGYMANFANGFNNLMDIFETVVGDVATTVRAMANGDLTRMTEVQCKGQFAELTRDINTTIRKLTTVLQDINDSAGNVKTGALEIAGGNNDLSQRTEQQAASIEETSAAMEQITSSVKECCQRDARHGQ